METPRAMFGRATIGAALALGIGLPASAAPLPPHEVLTVSALRLDVGKRWETDAHVRQAMSEIRDALAADFPAWSAGAMNAARYEALAHAIDARTSYMIANCALPPEADAQLHIVLTQIAQGSAAMKGYDPNLARRTGAERIVAALRAYSRYFDHPGWKGIAD